MEREREKGVRQKERFTLDLSFQQNKRKVDDYIDRDRETERECDEQKREKIGKDRDKMKEKDYKLGKSKSHWNCTTER